MTGNAYGYFAGQDRGASGSSTQPPQQHSQPIKGSWEDPRFRTRTLDAPFSERRNDGSREAQAGPSTGIDSGRHQHYGAMSSSSNTSSNAMYDPRYGNAQAGPSRERAGRDGVNDLRSYPSDQHYLASTAASSSSSRPYHGANGSPTLPSLQTSNPNGGFTDLYAQLEAQMNEIQAKHSPLSSPITPTQHRQDQRVDSRRARANESRLAETSAYLQGPRTPSDSAYGADGIISIYDRAPSPLPTAEAPISDRYGRTSQPEASSSRAPYNDSVPHQYIYQHAQPDPLGHQRQPVTAPYVPRPRTTSATTIATVNSNSSQRRPLPMSPPRNTQDDDRGSLPRPSQDSYASSGHGYFAYNSGIAAPRPSMSSTYSGKSLSNGPRDVRPLPVPSEDDASFSLSAGDLSGTSTYETASSLSSSRSVQSDFSRDFYAAGSSVPDELRQTSQCKPRKKTSSQPTNTSGASNHVSASVSYPEAIQRQAPSVRQASRPSTAGTSETSRSGSYKTGLAGQGHSNVTYDNRGNATASISTSSLASPVRSASMAQPGLPPPIVHTQSDPVANGRRSGHTDRIVSQPSRSQTLNHSAAKTPATRSASFSTSGSQRTPLRSQMSAASTASRSGRPSLPEISPPLPSSPSISISHSLDETSANSSYTEHTSTSYRSGSLQKQASLAPSIPAGLGYLGSMRRDPEREKRRAERLGIQDINPALLSNLAQTLNDRVPRGLNIKGAVHYPTSFTGEQLVTTLAEALPFPYTDDRRVAHSIARTLHENMFFHEVDWEVVRLKDSAEQVFCFEDDEEQSTFDYLNSSSATKAGPSCMTNRTGRQQDELPTGVMTRFTKCYSPFCGQENTSGVGSCYSLYCPNGSHPLGLKRKVSSISLAASSEEAAPAEAWASTVPADLIERLGPQEVARQNVIFEIVTGEQAYKTDLDMLENAFQEPLMTADPPVVYPTRLVEFSNQVFANLDELRSHSARLIAAFQIRQREQNPVVTAIGDIILDAALEWGQAYMDYADAQVMGEYLVNEEKSQNSAFSTFLASRREAFGIKQEFRHYHLRPTIRLQRYLLPLAEYVKRTPEEHPDRENAQEAMRIIREQCAACDAAVADAQLRLACKRYDRLIEKDGNYSNDLDLQDPTRQLFHHGKMFSKPEGTLAEWTEYQVMVFDHYLCIAKPRRTVEGYRLIQKPIRLEMLGLSGWESPALLRSAGFHLRSVIGTGERREAAQQSSATMDSKMWPVQFQIGGRSGGTLTLYVESSKMDREDKARQVWRAKTEQAIAVRKAALDVNKVFELRLLVDPESRKPSPTNAPHPALGEVLTSCPFNGPSGQPLLAVGTRNGLFIAMRNDPASLRQILQIPTVGCAVLQDFGMFLVQTEGRLLSYLLETLVQSSSAGDVKGQQGPQQVSGQKDITFFKVGKVGERTLVVYAKRDGVNSTVLKAMEPVANIERSRIQHSRFLGMGGKKTEWFRLFKDGGVPTAVYTLSFTRSKLALVCAPGFEILDIETLKTGSFPDWTAIKADPTKFDLRMLSLQRRCSISRAIALFRISDSEFLFCYDSFAFFADRHGDPLADRLSEITEWEGRPDSVVYLPPYVLAFDTRFIEVRDISQRGKLVQFINGANIRCCYDGQGIPSSEIDVRLGASKREPEERKPHVVMRDGKTDKIFEIAFSLLLSRLDSLEAPQLGLGTTQPCKHKHKAVFGWSLFDVMAKAKNRTHIIKLISTAGTGVFYTTTRLRAAPEKLQRMKYDWAIKKHVLFTEGKAR